MPRHSVGYFQGLSSERGIAWRVADSLSLRSLPDLDVTERSLDHSTLSRTRRLIDVDRLIDAETHGAVFTWVLERPAEEGLGEEDGRNVPATNSPPHQYDHMWSNEGMQTVMVSELKAKLSGYLAQVRRGATVTVCDRHTPIARLVPLEGNAGELDVREATATGDLPTATGITLKKQVDVLALLRADRDQR